MSHNYTTKTRITILQPPTNKVYTITLIKEKRREMSGEMRRDERLGEMRREMRREIGSTAFVKTHE